MMQAWWPIAAVLLGAGGLIWLLTRVQSISYRSYLDKHVAETAKMAEAQRLTLDALARQSAALERIATALERE